MTDRDKSILEEPEKMCDYCCNFDKEHIGMDGTALCKLTMTLAYAEDYSGNCMFYNVPKEQIIVPPCKVGDKVFIIEKEYRLNKVEHKIITCKIEFIYISSKTKRYHTKKIECPYMDNGFNFRPKDIGKTVFLTKEEAEEKLRELNSNDL